MTNHYEEVISITVAIVESEENCGHEWIENMAKFLIFKSFEEIESRKEVLL